MYSVQQSYKEIVKNRFRDLREILIINIISYFFYVIVVEVIITRQVWTLVRYCFYES